jgi:hypothetical protein
MRAPIPVPAHSSLSPSLYCAVAGRGSAPAAMRVLQVFAPMAKWIPEVEEPSGGKRVQFRCEGGAGRRGSRSWCGAGPLAANRGACRAGRPAITAPPMPQGMVSGWAAPSGAPRPINGGRRSRPGSRYGSLAPHFAAHGWPWGDGGGRWAARDPAQRPALLPTRRRCSGGRAAAQLNCGGAQRTTARST